ncbi:MAG: MurR/RpiR family transcriptional regulator [Culicoidibacterales bacterium]
MKLDFSVLKNKYKLSNAEEEVLQYILENIELVKELSVRDIALNCYCSTGVIMNLSKKLGYSGYSDMVYRLQIEVKGKMQLSSNHEHLKKHSDFTLEKQAEFIELLKNHKAEAIYIVASGFCEPLAEYIQEKLMVLGFSSFLTWHFENFNKPHSKNPLVFCISKSGDTNFVLEIAKYCKQKNFEVLSFTHYRKNELQNLSTLHFSLLDDASLDESNTVANMFYPTVLFVFEHLIGCYLAAEN